MLSIDPVGQRVERREIVACHCDSFLCCVLRRFRSARSNGPLVYHVTVVEGYTDAHEVLAVIEGVTNVSSNGRSVEFEYTSDEQEAAELLRALIAREVPVVSFAVVKASLEEAYLRAGVRQVD